MSLLGVVGLGCAAKLIDDARISRQVVSDGPGGIGTSRSGEDGHHSRPTSRQHATASTGDSKCRNGEHADWGAQSRYHSYLSEKPSKNGSG